MIPLISMTQGLVFRSLCDLFDAMTLGLVFRSLCDLFDAMTLVLVFRSLCELFDVCDTRACFQVSVISLML